MKADDTPCPKCFAAPGCLSIGEQLMTDPVWGSDFMRVTEQYRPVLKCLACKWAIVGVYRGQHAVFRKP